MKTKGVKEIMLSNQQVRPTIIQGVFLCSMNTTIPLNCNILTDFLISLKLDSKQKFQLFSYFV